MNGLVEDFRFECYSSSMAEYGTDMEYKFVELMSLYMKIGIGLVKMLVCHIHRLLNLLKSIFK